MQTGDEMSHSFEIRNFCPLMKLWSLLVVFELLMSAICIQGWFHCRGEDRPDALIGAGVARQQMSSWLGGGLPVEENK